MSEYLLNENYQGLDIALIDSALKQIDPAVSVRVDEFNKLWANGEFNQAVFDRYLELKNDPALLDAYKPIVAISPRQLRLALFKQSVSIETIEATIDSLEEPLRTEVKISWMHTTEFERNHPLLLQMQPILQLTDEQLDSIWRLGATL